MILWDEMKLKLREQYLPSFYCHQLLDQLWTLSQGTSMVKDYYSRFVEHKLRSAVQEELAVTVSRFIHGLKDDLKHKVSKSRPNVLENAFCQALEAETFVTTTFRVFWSACNCQPNSHHYEYEDGVFRTI